MRIKFSLLNGEVLYAQRNSYEGTAEELADTMTRMIAEATAFRVPMINGMEAVIPVNAIAYVGYTEDAETRKGRKAGPRTEET
jgi:hypothetical protein